MPNGRSIRKTSDVFRRVSPGQDRMIQWLKKIDWILALSVLLFATVSIVSLYSISFLEISDKNNIFLKQISFIFLGIGAMILFSLFDYHYLQFYSRYVYFFSIILLVIVLFLGDKVRGMSGWIGFNSFHFQPVEFAKLSLVVILASFIAKKKSQLGEIKGIIFSFFLSAVIFFLVILQPDLGSMIILLGIWLGMMLISGINKKNLFYLVAVIASVLIAGWFLLADYQKMRIFNVVSPENDPRGSGYNVIQSMVAIGSGGLIGKGIGHGSQSQLNFIPEKHTDFIFAVISEEWGLIGSFFVLAVYLIFFARIRKVAENSNDNFGYMLAIGILVMFFLQTIINIGMNLGIVPVAGIPLPFLSYGGSSLIVSFISVGIIMNIRKGRKDLETKIVI